MEAAGLEHLRVPLLPIRFERREIRVAGAGQLGALGLEIAAVAIVTVPGRPACMMISASRSWNFAFST
jgi:hypothetical protein